MNSSKIRAAQQTNNEALLEHLREIDAKAVDYRKRLNEMDNDELKHATFFAHTYMTAVSDPLNPEHRSDDPEEFDFLARRIYSQMLRNAG